VQEKLNHLKQEKMNDSWRNLGILGEFTNRPVTFEQQK